MEAKVMHVTHYKKYNRLKPRIHLAGEWLTKIGFESGKSAIIKYESGGIVLRLQETDDYKDLVKGAFKDGSGLFQVTGRTRNQKNISQIHISGFRLEHFGFTIGSAVAIYYEYGFIKIRLLDLEKLYG